MRTYKISEVAVIIGIHPSTVRLYEQLKLIPEHERLSNGYRVFTDFHIEQLKIIRSLRCANYSLEAILRLLQQLSQNPDTDIRSTLNTPKQSDDIISVCGRLIVSLSEAEKNAYKILAMLQNMKKNFS